MKLLHKSNLYCWTQFDQDRNIDFHSYLWVRGRGNVVFDPLPKDSVKRVALIKGINAILPGDGWPVFRNGEQALLELVASI